MEPPGPRHSKAGSSCRAARRLASRRRRPVRSLLLSFSLAALLAAPAPLERLHLEWQVPEGCPGREALAAALESSVPADRTFHASVRVDGPEREGEPWRAVVLT